MGHRKEISHTLDSHIVHDAIIATTLVDTKTEKYLGGGMAVQSYLPHNMYRPTRDVDFTFNQPLNYEAYKDLMSDTIGLLKSQGYEISVEKAGQTFGIVVENDAQSLSIQTRRMNDQSFVKNYRRNAREYSNSEARIVGPTTTRVIRPEDLMLRKLVRTLSFERTYGLKPQPWSGNLRKQLQAITSFRKPLLDSLQDNPVETFTPQIQHIIATIRMQADLFDIGALMRTVGCDEKYFREGMQDYEGLRQNEAKVLGILHGTLTGRTVPACFFPNFGR